MTVERVYSHKDDTVGVGQRDGAYLYADKLGEMFTRVVSRCGVPWAQAHSVGVVLPRLGQMTRLLCSFLPGKRAIFFW